ncbi:PilN domain-containing protein [Trinickia terrae]|uniref:PilN domain-containing protein n=1 Tax=Trinickia terrae TaxID=2571161 RepID=A0A4U1HX67_9BURK|nr:PilN domain-containing protein [Trinickia terrae]TKC86309.1 PilN domain-containing protein [Trinickia terrae]
MKHLLIDFAPFGWRRQLHRIHPAARWLAMAGLLLCVLAGVRAHKLLGRLDALDAQAARYAVRAAAAARAPETATREPIDAKQAAAVNAAVARLNLPWDDILNALEAATPSQVAVLSITPEAGSALIRIEAEGNNSEDMIAYLKALGRQPLFARVYLVKHELAKDGMDGVFRFQIEAAWRGGAP